MVVKIPLLKKFYDLSDAVSVWGGISTISTVKSQLPAKCKLIEWGHKVSFAYISNSMRDDSLALDKLADDCLLFDQSACSSPQCIFVEDLSLEGLKDFSSKFYDILNLKAESLPELQLDINSQCELTNYIELNSLESLHMKKGVLGDQQTNVRVVYTNEPNLEFSPTFRNVYNKKYQAI